MEDNHFSNLLSTVSNLVHQLFQTFVQYGVAPKHSLSLLIAHFILWLITHNLLKWLIPWAVIVLFLLLLVVAFDISLEAIELEDHAVHLLSLPRVLATNRPRVAFPFFLEWSIHECHPLFLIFIRHKEYTNALLLKFWNFSVFSLKQPWRCYRPDWHTEPPDRTYGWWMAIICSLLTPTTLTKTSKSI